MRKEEYLDFTGLSTFLGNLKNFFASKEELNELDITVEEMQGATLNSPGQSGLVPAPSKGQHTYFLRGDGVWADLSLYFEKIGMLESEIESLKQLISDVEDLNISTVKTSDGMSVLTDNNEKIVLNVNEN
ncbi:hypothetical protein AALB52_21885 [Lachnospiraceae bacterium 38-14]